MLLTRKYPFSERLFLLCRFVNTLYQEELFTWKTDTSQIEKWMKNYLSVSTWSSTTWKSASPKVRVINISTAGWKCYEAFSFSVHVLANVVLLKVLFLNRKKIGSINQSRTQWSFHLIYPHFCKIGSNRSIWHKQWNMFFRFEVNSFCQISQVVIKLVVPKVAMCSYCSEIFTFNTKLPIMAMLAEKEIFWKINTSSGAWPTS